MPMHGPCVAVVLAIASLAVGAPASAAPSLSPKALLQALKTHPPPASELPKGIGTPSFVTFTLTANSVAHHALGAIGAAWNSAYVKIVVFPSHALAAADIRAAPNWSISPNPAPAPYPQPSHVYTDPAQGAAYFVFTLGDTVVEAGSNTQAGSPPGQGMPIAQKLAKIALAYVDSVTSPATS